MDGKEEKPQQTERSPSLPEAGPGAAVSGSDTHNRSISAHVHLSLLPQAGREAAWLR